MLLMMLSKSVAMMICYDDVTFINLLEPKTLDVV